MLMFGGVLSAQQPAYYLLGEDQFRGMQIYDVIQDNHLNYWFATNEGLFLYDHYSFHPIDPKGAKTRSVFGFVMDTVTGYIYCHNLSSQVFRISGRHCDLFYELKKDEASPDVSLAITGQGELVVACSKLLVFDRRGHMKLRYDPQGGYISPLYSNRKGEVMAFLSGFFRVLIYSSDSFRKVQLKLNEVAEEPSSLRFCSSGEDVLGLDGNSGRVYSLDLNTNSLRQLHVGLETAVSRRIYETGAGAWLASSYDGVVFLRNADVNLASIFYPDYFISKVYQDRDGNTLLATFGNGVLVVPDLNIPDAIKLGYDDLPTAICSDTRSGTIFIGTSNGNFLSYSSSGVRPANSRGTKTIEGIFGSSKSDVVVYDNGYVTAFDGSVHHVLKGPSPSLKQAAVVSDSLFYIATNIGLFKAGKHGGALHIRPVEGLSGRTYFCVADPDHDVAYAYSNFGLFLLRSDTGVTEVRYQDSAIIADCMAISSGRLYVSTSRHGLLEFKKDKFVRKVMLRHGGRAEAFDKLIVYQNTFIGSARSGLLQFDLNGNFIRSLDIDYHFPDKNIMDFSVRNDTLWVCHTGGVQMLDLKYNSPSARFPVLRLDSLRVNDSTGNFIGETNFSSADRRFDFIVSSPGLRDKAYTVYRYRLLGYDTVWRENKYEQNHITYSSLPPGNYTFEVKARRHNAESNLVRYSFYISPPFYLTWYFILGCSTLLAFVIWYLFRRQLKIQARKARQINELNISKLTALRSQMNPHFIFNSLNSIQDLILKGDVENSYSYVSTFSDLMRRSLTYSGKELIELDEEISLLKLYLSLERLRFKRDFEYSIEPGNTTDIKIPPMLIQPFIENAIVHGLLHKEGKKVLKVTFTLAGSLVCRIEDNGVGRERAAEILRRQRADHESFASKAIKRRFEVLSELYKGNFGYSYIDLPHGSGTVVILTIPVVTEY